MDIAKFSVRNPVLVNLLMIALFIFGFLALNRMPTELNPNINFNWVFVNVPYAGASPVEIENLIIDPIETEIQDVDKIDDILSTASESLGSVIIKFKDVSDDDFNELFNEIKNEVDKVDFPEDAEDPFFIKFTTGDFIPVIDINMAYTIPDANAQLIADELEEELKDMKGVAKAQVSGLADREIWVEVKPEKLHSYNVTFEEIIVAIKSRNLNVPGGNISVGRTEYLIRALGEYKSVDEIANTILRKNADGHIIQVKDVATVNDRRQELEIYSRTNGNKSITFSISKKNEANSLDVIDDVKELVAQYQSKVPDGIEFNFLNDNSTYINRVIDILKNNAFTGMILIVLVLYLFLGKSNALLASLGIPISFFITFIFMYLFGESLNGSSLFALVMVLGIIVDDAIIVIENCHRYRLMGFSSHDAAIMGAREVARPILSSIATNIAAFLPLMLLPGIMGKFMRIIPIVFSLALLASMFEAFYLLPSHYADWTLKSKSYKQGEKKFFVVLREYYTRMLVKVLRWRYLVLGGMVFILFMSLAAIPMIGIELFPDEDFDQVSCLIKMPEGSSLQETDRILKKYEDQALSLPKEYFDNVVTNVGLYQGRNEWLVRKDVGQINVKLKDPDDRSVTTKEVMDMWREKCDHLSGPMTIEFMMVAGGPPTGKPISVKVQGKYIENIKAAAMALQDSIKNIEGTLEVADDFPEGKKEINIVVDEEKANLYGFSAQYLALNIRYAFDGVEATEYRDGDEEIDVIVKFAEENRESLDDILDMKVTNPQGQTVALRDLVSFEIKPGPSTIRRFDQKRTIMVTGEIDDAVTSLDVVSFQIGQYFPGLEAKFPGVTFSFGGEFDEFMNTFSDMTQLFVISILIMFIILGTQFNSYAQPMVILMTIPFALIGAMLGLIVTGNPFSITAMFGFVALAGIVVNDAIVLISFFNNERNKETITRTNVWRSLINSGRLRLRPIILTSMTTIFGLLPMAVGIGGMSYTWAPLANVILFGLMVATILTLFVIPCMLAVIDDLKRTRKKTKLLKQN